jgi:hypothetical protein
MIFILQRSLKHFITKTLPIFPTDKIQTPTIIPASRANPKNDVTETKVIKAAHKPGEKEITKEPTTTEKGEAIIKCTVCGEVIETIELDVKSPETSDNANVVVFAVVALVAAAALVVVGKKRFAL